MGVSIRPPLMMLAVHPCLRPAVAGLTAGAGHAAAARKVICMSLCVAKVELGRDVLQVGCMHRSA